MSAAREAPRAGTRRGGRLPLQHAFGLDIFDGGRGGSMAAKGGGRCGGGQAVAGRLVSQIGMGGSALSGRGRGRIEGLVRMLDVSN